MAELARECQWRTRPVQKLTKVDDIWDACPQQECDNSGWRHFKPEQESLGLRLKRRNTLILRAIKIWLSVSRTPAELLCLDPLVWCMLKRAKSLSPGCQIQVLVSGFPRDLSILPCNVRRLSQAVSCMTLMRSYPSTVYGRGDEAAKSCRVGIQRGFSTGVRLPSVQQPPV